KDSDGTIVSASVAYNDVTKTVTLTPTVALTAASKYFAIIDGDVTDINGNHIISITKNFTTA
ncbi:MAG TPA: Ig-like domain-containing protein, partial [Clostridium sp.]